MIQLSSFDSTFSSLLCYFMTACSITILRVGAQVQYQLTPLTRVQEAHSGSFGRAADNLHGSDDDAAYVIL